MRVQMPYVARSDYLLFEESSVRRGARDTYRALEARLRQNHCHACHAPNNQGNSAQLAFFVYPNQALAGRHDIVAQLEANEMPPEDSTLELPAEIADSGQRELRVRLARGVESAGDQVLAWEGDHRPEFP